MADMKHRVLLGEVHPYVQKQKGVEPAIFHAPAHLAYFDTSRDMSVLNDKIDHGLLG